MATRKGRKRKRRKPPRGKTWYELVSQLTRALLLLTLVVLVTGDGEGPRNIARALIWLV